MEEQRAAAEAAQKAKVDAAVSKLEGQRPSIYQNAEAAAKQAYINKMLAQRDMAQQMTASGLSGGLSDSALIAMNSDYENSRNSILQNQSNALNELNTNINQVKAGGDLSLAEMQSQYQAALAQQAAQELQRQQELQNQMDLLAYKAQLEREAAAQAAGDFRRGRYAAVQWPDLRRKHSGQRSVFIGCHTGGYRQREPRLHRRTSQSAANGIRTHQRGGRGSKCARLCDPAGAERL